MADNSKSAYIGRVGNTGTQVVKAPIAPKGGKGKAIVHKGNDLRVKGGK